MIHHSGYRQSGVLPLHLVRQRFATTAYNKGNKDLIAIQHALGHQSITDTQRYTQAALDLKDLIIATEL